LETWRIFGRPPAFFEILANVLYAPRQGVIVGTALIIALDCHELRNRAIDGCVTHDWKLCRPQ
jgi:hypothetical protein